MRVTFKRDAREIEPVNGVSPIRAVDAKGERQKQHQAQDAGAEAGTGAAPNKPHAQAPFNAERVAQLRAALAEGRIEFDAAKLAGLIQRYHGGEK